MDVTVETKKKRQTNWSAFFVVGREIRLAYVAVPVFQGLLQLGHKSSGVRSIDDAMVESQGEPHNVANRDAVVAVGIGDDCWLLEQAANAEDGRLRLIDHRSSKLFSENAGVGDGEGTFRDFIRLEFLGARTSCEVCDGAGDAKEAALLGIFDDRNDEPPVECNRDADVDVFVVANRVAFHRSVHDRHFAQAADNGAGDKRHVGQLDAITLLVLRFFALANLDDPRHVNLEDAVNVGAGVLRFHHALGDDGAHLAERNQVAGDGDFLRG